jgi:small subunit ribosomal protein S2
VDFVIPGNDDALRAIRLFASKIADAVISGRGARESAHADEGGEGGDDERTRRSRPARQPRSEQASPASV